MSRNIYWCTTAAVLLSNSCSALADADTDLQVVREQVQQLERRIDRQANSVQAVSVPAARAGGEGAFNPAISLVLGGTYGNVQQDSSVPATGFSMNPNPGHPQGFSLGESELGISANIDPQFRGVGTFSLDPAGGISVENAFVQTTALDNGLNLRFGRYFSGIGYLNEQHAHAWDFTDQPLVYATLWDNQLVEDGIQLRWLAPADTFIEVGGELGRGYSFPASDRRKNGAGSSVLFAHVGDDIGIEQSWRAGASFYQTHAENRVSNGVPDLLATANGVSNRYAGDSRTVGLDFVWKYAPNGNTAVRYVKVQGEFFRRKEDGWLTYDIFSNSATAGPTTASYDVTQSAWYLQGVYQFVPHWRSGMRYDQLNPGAAAVGAANAANVISYYGFRPSRATWMVDYSPSEFSRLRLQLASDKSRQGYADKQFFLQYIMSLGAHGAHQY